MATQSTNKYFELSKKINHWGGDGNINNMNIMPPSQYTSSLFSQSVNFIIAFPLRLKIVRMGGYSGRNVTCIWVQSDIGLLPGLPALSAK